ncbi:hypothetical protein DRV85_17045 [Rhodosalinus halophilus]|uniref:Uncharacterized protein n=1 Tax=Rhodosalinus halophilus TaxID=2259333 RepID=A0A365U4Q9_9RHOB|nr:hypothetical protein [Rhodosalinus halophilus]RBI83153.1 hypothetical protein DRV85_17045 [Rhodosalinus halophilus]
MGKIVDFFEHVALDPELVDRLDRIAARQIVARGDGETALERPRQPEDRPRAPLRVRKYRW